MPEYDNCSPPKLVRLKRRSEFVFVRGGKSDRKRSVVVQARRRKDGKHIGLGFTATKKVGGAVVRNRAKRRMRAAAALLLPEHGAAGFDYVFIARKDTSEVAWKRLLDDMESALISLAGASGDHATQG
ncbi:MAG: ribonuclease P protein component [Pseudomonadota bacterium]